ncbi:C4-dicarboxylate TRAP transporter large permease protein DctM [Thalassocella blandensis]|nr:C4-dicarboxylate TRAP transporter large permease protein DctM [Thalassocella blandensis]
MLELLPLLMFVFACFTLMMGYPVAFTLAGVALLFAGIGIISGTFHAEFLLNYPERVFGTISNYTLIAVPLFVFMGVMLERSKIAEELLENMAKACGRLPAGLGISVVAVGALMAASTGIVGATVVTMGLMSLPTMLKKGYSPALATGTICATGTLGQIIPPSIALVLLGDIISSAYQQAQLDLGIFNAAPVSVGDLFLGAIVPGVLLVVLYTVFLFLVGVFKPELAPPDAQEQSFSRRKLITSILPPIGLILLVLGSIISGRATPTEAAGVGAIAATLLATIKGQLTLDLLRDVARTTTICTAMVFAILLGASLFSLVFNGLGGEQLIHHFFENLPGGAIFAVFIVMVVIFVLGFILDFIEITFVVVPMIGPVLLKMGVDPVWLGIMIAINLQTSFLTPPFGFALFYLRGVAPKELKTSSIYRGVAPFIVIQLILLVVLAIWPDLVTWLPKLIKT